MIRPSPTKPFGAETRALIEREARQIASRVAEAHGCTAELDWFEGYPSVVNDPVLTNRAEQVIGDRFGKERTLPIGVIMPGEDFSRYGRADPANIRSQFFRAKLENGVLDCRDVEVFT